jgi:hypothetical protein
VRSAAGSDAQDGANEAEAGLIICSQSVMYLQILAQWAV